MNRINVPQNVHFVYEHALAHFELREGFGLKVKWDPLNPWELYANLDGRVDELLNRAAYVGTVDGESSVYAQLIRPKYREGRFNRTRSENQYLTHWIYPYKGKFHPQMIRAILNGIGARIGSTVLDPFSGSGTALLESQLLGVNSIGIDASPLCVLLAKVKTGSWQQAEEIQRAVAALSKKENLHPDEVSPKEWGSDGVADFIEIARMVTYSDACRRGRDPRRYFISNLRNMTESARAMKSARRKFSLKFGKVRVVQGDARDLSRAGIKPETVDAIITSPPYSIALDYVKNDEHALIAMGQDTELLRENFVGVRGRGPRDRLELYRQDMRVALSQMARAVKPAGHVVIVMGNATLAGKEVLTTSELIQWAETCGLVLRKQIDKIVWGLYNVVKDEKILFFLKA